MSVRLLTQRLLGHGRAIVHNYCRRNIHHINIFDRRGPAAAAVESRRAATANNQHQNQKAGQPQSAIATVRAPNSTHTSGLFRFGQHARRLFVDSILSRVAPSAYAAGMRADATKKLLYGDSAPFLSLIGVSLATGGILTKDDELEGVCWEIREAVSRLQGNWGRETVSQAMNGDFGLADLDIGPPIAKGCAAVVYAAAFKEQARSGAAETPQQPLNPQPHPTRDMAAPLMSPIQNTSRFVHNFGGSVDNLLHHHHRQSQPQMMTASPIVDEFRRRSTLDAGQAMAKRARIASIGESEYEREYRRDAAEEKAEGATEASNASAASFGTTSPAGADAADLVRYPFALKMMFNYDIQSNAMAILRAMYKETIPARNKHRCPRAWEKILRQQTVSLPPHPNIVLMFGVFCDQIPNLAPGASLYPMALPPRINPNGYGRNMSLFLLMKRYNHRLCEYLADNSTTLSARTRILIFAQLLEGVAHLHRYGVAHRDLKSDNILIDLNDDVHPVVVLSDFGCCLADRTHGLQLPYTSADIDKGGNAALMAPEIYGQQPGTFSILDYGKADLWACGALAYEVFGRPNPFYAAPSSAESATGLRNSSYKDEDLPQLPTEVPYIVRALVENILQRNQRRRLSPPVAANVMQLFLWAPSAWLRPDGNPSSTEILQWLLSLTTKVLCENRGRKPTDAAEAAKGADSDADAFGYRMGRRTYTEYLLISSFLVRARLETVRSAMSWIQNVVSY